MFEKTYLLILNVQEEGNLNCLCSKLHGRFILSLPYVTNFPTVGECNCIKCPCHCLITRPIAPFQFEAWGHGVEGIMIKVLSVSLLSNYGIFTYNMPLV